MDAQCGRTTDEHLNAVAGAGSDWGHVARTRKNDTIERR